MCAFPTCSCFFTQDVSFLISTLFLSNPWFSFFVSRSLSLSQRHVSSIFQPQLIGRFGVPPGGQLLSLPDPNDAVGHADYFEHIDKVMSMGLPLTSGDGETDASPLIFGLDDKSEFESLGGGATHIYELMLFSCFLFLFCIAFQL
jgi:hypothetical protein